MESLPSLLTYLFTCLLTYLLTYLLAYLLTYLITYLLACLLTYLLTNLLAYLLTYLLTYILTYSLTYPLTPHGTVLQKLTGSQLVKKFPAFYGTRRFITAFTSARTCLYPEPARSSPYPHIPLPQDPSSHLTLGLPSGLFPSDFPTKTLYTTLLSSPHISYMPRPSHSSVFYHPNNIR